MLITSSLLLKYFTSICLRLSALETAVKGVFMSCNISVKLDFKNKACLSYPHWLVWFGLTLWRYDVEDVPLIQRQRGHRSLRRPPRHFDLSAVVPRIRWLYEAIWDRPCCLLIHVQYISTAVAIIRLRLLAHLFFHFKLLSFHPVSINFIYINFYISKFIYINIKSLLHICPVSGRQHWFSKKHLLRLILKLRYTGLHVLLALSFNL